MKSTGRTKALSLLLALAIALSLLPTAALAEGTTLAGSGTAEEPYLIAGAADLAAFRDMVNGGDNAAAHAQLTADIVLSGDWAPFNPDSGYPADAYAGVFDGGGHTVSGLKVEDAGSNGVGLFGTVNGATIKNLHVEGTVSASNSSFVGGIVGKTQGAVTIQSCSFSGSVSSSKAGNNAGVGGIVGRVNAGSVTLSDCANAATITGGAAGGILGYCSAKGTTISACANTGTVTGSARTGGIAGQVATTTEITGCTSTQAPISGFNGVLTDCTIGQAVKDPRLIISGSADLYDVNYGPKPAATLTARFVDLDPSAVAWSLAAGQEVVELVTPDNVDGNNTTVSVQARRPGKATVTATAGEYSGTLDITVWPFVTTMEIKTPMTAAVDGQTVDVELSGAAADQVARAKINILGGGELDAQTFPVTVQWKYLTAEDYAAGNTGSYQSIPGATALEYLVPPEREGDYLSFTLRYNGQDKAPNRTSKVRSATQATEEAQQQAQREQTAKTLQEVLEGCTLRPVWGEDENVARLLESYLEGHGLSGFTAQVQAVEEVYGGGGVAEDGHITYFYADPNATPAIHNASCRVTFTLTGDGQSREATVPVIIPWDQDKVKAVLREEIAPKLTLDTAAAVSGDLTLPKVVDGKKWALISWASSADAITVSDKNQTTADTLFDPYVGVVKRGKREQSVTLTATVNFQLAADGAPIALVLTYPLTVKALEPTQQERIEAELRAKLEAGLAAAGVTNAATGEKLAPGADGVYTALHDIQLPTTRDFGVDGKYYPVTITTDTDALVAPGVRNAARVEVYRPGVGQADAAGNVTITLEDKDTDASASLVLPVAVPALTQAEVDAELALMDRVKAAYFDGLKGENTARDNVRTDLVPFFEVYEDQGELVWVRANAQRTGRGIVPIPMEGWEELELWRLFKSSNPNVISHENLRVTRQAEAKAVSVTSHLSSQTLGRYGQLYQEDPVRYAQYAELAPLYDQAVTTDAAAPQAALFSLARTAAAETMVVRGTRDPESAAPVAQTIDDVTISLAGLDGQSWVAPQTYSGLPESASVYDLFLKMLGKDYVTTRVKGTYIQAITGPQGTLTEKQYGEDSGWMYRLNGQLPEIYMGACPLHSGDEVQVFYTRDASQESPIWSRPTPIPTAPAEPTAKPTAKPTVTPSARPTSTPAAEPTATPSAQPTATPTAAPSAEPSASPSATPSASPSPLPAPGYVSGISRPSPSKTPGEEPSQSPAPARFADVAADAWYADALATVCDAGLMEGVAPGRFAPEVELNRGMLATMLYRLAAPETQSGDAPFSDVARDAWYAASAAWAVEAGVVTGYDADTFGGDDPITREQLAVMLFRYAQMEGRSTAGRDSLTTFADTAAISPWAREAMAWAVDSGILTGLPDGTLAPAATATRAQAAVMLTRYLKRSI